MELKRKSQKSKGNFLIAFATQLEAAATLSRFQAVEEKEGLYRFELGAIAITGMGSCAAMSFLASVEFDEVLNIGFAASLKGEEIGTLLEVGSVEKLPFLPEGDASFFHAIHPSISLGKGGKLMTSDFPVHHKALKEKIQADLIDMEGYGIAFLCRKMQKKLTMWKIVSDFGEEGGRALIQQSGALLSEQMATYLWNILKEKTP